MSAVARRERARTRSLRIGLVSLVAAIAVTAFALTAQNGMPDYVPGVERTEVAAQFKTTGALRAGDDVRIANVRSGYVDSIELVDGKPVVNMRLDDGREVYADAKATIRSRSALGQKYVDLDPGSEDAGAIEDTIPLNRTTEAVELDDVLGALDPKTRTALQATLRQTGGGLVGRGKDLQDGLDGLDSTLTDLGDVSDALAVDDGSDLTQMLVTAESVASSLNQQEHELASMTEQLATTVEAIGTDDQEPLGQVLLKAPSTLREVRQALVDLDGPLADTKTATIRLLPGARALATAMPDTRGLLRESVEPLEAVPGVAEVADPAVSRLTGTLADARPLVARLGTTVSRGRAPLMTLAPYAPEALLFFKNAADALSHGDASGHWLRFYPVVNAENVIGNLPIDSPLLQREAYPDPGEAPQHRTNHLQVIP